MPICLPRRETHSVTREMFPRAFTQKGDMEKCFPMSFPFLETWGEHGGMFPSLGDVSPWNTANLDFYQF